MNFNRYSPYLQNIDFNTLELALEILKKHGISHVIAGGAPRDVYLGRIAKDVDVCVPINYESVQDGSLVSAMLELESLQASIDCAEHEGSEGDPRMAGVMKLHGNIDVIQLNSYSVEDIVNNFDFNINQFVVEAGRVEFKGENLGILTEVRGLDGNHMRTFKRQHKLEGIAIEHNWAIDCESATEKYKKYINEQLKRPQLPRWILHDGY